MKRKIKFCAIIAIVASFVFIGLDIMPVACPLGIVDGSAYLIAHYSGRGSKSRQNNDDTDDYTINSWWWMNNN